MLKKKSACSYTERRVEAKRGKVCKEKLTLADLLLESNMCQQGFNAFGAYDSAFPFTINIIRDTIQAYSRGFIDIFFHLVERSYISASFNCTFISLNALDPQ